MMTAQSIQAQSPEELAVQIRGWLFEVEKQFSGYGYAKPKLLKLEPDSLKSLPLSDSEREAIHNLQVTERLSEQINSGFSEAVSIFGTPRQLRHYDDRDAAIEVWSQTLSDALSEPELDCVYTAFRQYAQTGRSFPWPVDIIKLVKSPDVNPEKEMKKT